MKQIPVIFGPVPVTHKWWLTLLQKQLTLPVRRLL